jgi:CBS domain containing-hemolysin-like protein
MEFIFQLVLVFLLIFLNGYFVASEFALVAVRKTRIDELAKKNGQAKRLRAALEELDRYISATQLGITIASLALGWIGEPAIAHFLEPFFRFLPQEAAFITSHTVAVAIAFTLITFFHIVLGELAPKTLALQRSETVALWVITPLIIFSKIFQPFIWLLNQSGQLVIKAFGLHETDDNDAHSEEEVKTILRQSSAKGVIPQKEVEMVYNVFQFGDIPAKTVMIPRTDILAFSISTPLNDVLKKITKDTHSRFPVYEDSIDNIIGFIHIKDIYRTSLKGKDVLNTTLSKLDIVRKVINVPEVKKIDSVLQEMRRKRNHLVVVKDEFGGTAGIITLEDIIESLVGEIEDEFDQPVEDWKKQRDGSYLVSGHMPIIDVQEKFHLSLKGQGYTTIGGLVFGLLGREPKVGDTIQVSELLFEVKELEGKRIKLLKLSRKKK